KKRSQLQAELEAEKAAKERAEALLKAALAENDVEKKKRGQLQAELKAEQAAKARAEGGLATRSDELVALTRLIHEKELAARDRGIMEALLEPRTVSLLPSPIRVWRQMARVRRSGLFDSDWYKHVHRDVAASGMDPLR